MADNPDPEIIRDAQNAQEDLNEEQERYKDNLYDIRGIWDELYLAIKGSADVVKSGISEEAKRRVIVKDSFGVLRNTLKTVRELRDSENGIKELNDNQLEKKKQLLKSDLSQLRTLSLQLAQSRGLVGASAEEILEREDLTENEKEILLARRAGFTVIRDAIKETDKQIKAYERMNSALGLSGALLDNLERVGVRAFGGLGINLSAFKSGFTDALEDGKEEARKIAEEMEAAGENTASYEQKLRVIQATAPGIRKALHQGLNDPLVFAAVAFKALGKAFNKVQTASVEVSRLTGQTATGMATMQSRIASTSDVLEIVSGLTKQIGFNANNVFSPGLLAAAAEFKNTLGLSAEQAGKLAILTRATGTNLDDNFESIVDSVNQFNKANRSAVSQGMVLRDVANVSDGISASLGGQAGAIAAASAAARRLGMELSNVDKIADTLMQFETSIGDELEAQLLTGKDINLAKARELALTNDLKGLGDELFKNSADLAEFSEMNRIQQQSLAQALGMSRDELARIAYLKALEAGMTEKQAAAAAQVNEEEMKRMTIQDNFSKALEKVAQALTPIVEGFALLAGNAPIFYAMLAAIATVSLTRTIGSLVIMAGQLKLMAAAGLTSAITLGGIAKGVAMVGLVFAALAGFSRFFSNLTKAEDAFIPPGEDRILLHPAGAIAFDDRDTIVAGTDLFGGGGLSGEVLAEQDSLEAETDLGGGRGSIRKVLAKLYRLIAETDLFGSGGLSRGVLAEPDSLEAEPVQDVTISPGTGRILEDSKESISFNDKNTVVAGTNLGGGGGSNREMLAKLDRLIEAVERGGNVYMDSNQVGRAMVLGSYKSA